MLSVRTLLIVIAVVAAWFATLWPEHGRDLRTAFPCLLLTLAICGAIHYRDIARAFWIGCLIGLVLMDWPSGWALGSYGVQLERLHADLAAAARDIFAQNDRANQFRFYRFVLDSLELVSALIVAGMCGAISALLYRDSRRGHQV